MAIDLIFAFPNYDEKGSPIGCALKLHGVPASGIAKIIGLKDRAMGRGDAEITIDYEFWKEASFETQCALLDHELTHLAPITNKHGVFKKDDLDRPKLRMRKHDFQVGWFDCIAKDHGAHSIERMQARELVEVRGQFYFPEMVAVDQMERSVIALRTATGK